MASGNLSSAQSAFAILQQAFAQSSSATSASSTSASSTSATSSSNPLAQEFQQLSSDLQSGNLTAAQKDYSTIQQDLQSQFSGHMHQNHHIRWGQGSSLDSSQTSQSGSSTTTQSGNASLQQTLAALAQQLQQYALGETADSAGGSLLTNPISFMA